MGKILTIDTVSQKQIRYLSLEIMKILRKFWKLPHRVIGWTPWELPNGEFLYMSFMDDKYLKF